MKYILKSIVIFIFLAANLQAQWYVKATVLRPFNNLKNSARRGGGIFFEQGKIWVAAPEDGSGNTINDEISFSSDLGTSWSKVSFRIRSDLTIDDFSFFDKNIGAAVTSNNGQLFLTSDGGLTWTYKMGGGSTIKMVSPSRLFTPFYYSNDGGSNWVSVFPPFPPITFNFCMDNMGVSYSSGDKALFISRDSGLTWAKKNETWDRDSYSCSAHTSCNDSVIYVNNEGFGQGYTFAGCHLDVSTDGGQSFRKTFVSSSLYLTGTVICCKHGLAYCSTFDGIMMTTDYGKSWNNMGGPGEMLDVRSFALINDSTIVALDTMGNVWMNEHLPVPKPIVHHPIAESFSMTNISSCDTGKGSITLRHTFCSPLFITTAEPLASTSPKFRIPSVSLPDTIDQTKAFTIPISFNPAKSVGAFTGGVKVHGYYLDEGDTILIDTTIFFSAVSTPVPPNFISSPSYLSFDTLSTCAPAQDTTVTLTNKGCDTLQIISGPGALAAEFSLITPLALPLKLAPDSSVKIRFRFKPSGTGFFNTRAAFTALQQTLTQDITINLEGEGEKDVGILSFAPQKFSFPSISICNHDSAGGFVANIGCDSLRLDPAAIISDPDFRVSGIGLRVSLKPKDTIFYTLYLNPAQKGIRQGYLVLNSNDGVKPRRDTIPFTVTVTDGTRILSTPVNALDFGATTLCDERDTVIHLRNTGCDTLRVLGYGVSGMGFTSNTKFPIILLPGDSTTIDIFTVLDTVGGKTSNSALLTFTSNSDNTLSPITLMRSYIQSRNINVGFFLDPQMKSGGDLSTVSYDIKESPGRSFSGSGIKQIAFNLNYNTNLLDFQKSLSSNNLSSTDGKNFTISGSPEISADANGVLASVGFRVYLTKDSATQIVMTSRSDTTKLPCNQMTLSMGGAAAFDYTFLCGERSIAGFMNGVLPMKIISMRPNPAQDEIEIEVQSAVKQNAAIEIFDALGSKKFSGSKNIQNGTNTIHLTTKGLASGMYVVRVGNASRSLVISR